MLEAQDGLVVSHPVEARQVWQQHFLAVDAGISRSLCDHAREVIAGQNASVVALPATVASVCTLPELERLFATSRTQGAPGEDGMPPRVYRLFAIQLRHPLVAKCSFRV